MAETYLEKNMVCMDCGEINLFVVRVYPIYDVEILESGIIVKLDDIELETEFASVSEKQQRDEYEDWICGRCGSERVVKRYEMNPSLDSYYSPLIPEKDVASALYYINEIKKEEKRDAVKMYK